MAPGRDFFGFCTTLTRQECTALGALSEVLHFEEGEVVYSTGDPAECLYIINRGVVEVVQDNGNKKTAETYLSRGDIFGDFETLSGTPHQHLVRTREAASLQCFRRRDFQNLIERVPSFFLYLSEQLARRLSQAGDGALAQSHCMELSGSLSNFDLVTIYQTILNSCQTGELRITNDESKAIANCYFKNGQPYHCRFEHLNGEEAIAQLFLSASLPGTFSFFSGECPPVEDNKTAPISRNGLNILFAALQARDEFAIAKRRVPDPSATVTRRELNIAWPQTAPEELRPLAEEVWQIVYSNPMSLTELFRRCSVCELKLYRVIDELVQSKHFELSPAPASSEKAAA
jgi:CRP-like cAMP-binding protein